MSLNGLALMRGLIYQSSYHTSFQICWLKLGRFRDLAVYVKFIIHGSDRGHITVSKRRSRRYIAASSGSIALVFDSASDKTWAGSLPDFSFLRWVSKLLFIKLCRVIQVEFKRWFKNCCMTLRE